MLCFMFHVLVLLIFLRKISEISEKIYNIKIKYDSSQVLFLKLIFFEYSDDYQHDFFIRVFNRFEANGRSGSKTFDHHPQPHV